MIKIHIKFPVYVVTLQNTMTAENGTTKQLKITFASVTVRMLYRISLINPLTY